jgi:hypothetical protein
MSKQYLLQEVHHSVKFLMVWALSPSAMHTQVADKYLLLLAGAGPVKAAEPFISRTAVHHVYPWRQ